MPPFLPPENFLTGIYAHIFHLTLTVMKGKNMSENESEKLIEFLEALKGTIGKWQDDVQEIIDAVKAYNNG